MQCSGGLVLDNELGGKPIGSHYRLAEVSRMGDLAERQLRIEAVRKREVGPFLGIAFPLTEGRS